MRALRDEATGGVYAYSDERQRVFARFGRPPLSLVPLVLDHNLRNTKQIASSFVSLAPSSMVLRGGEGPDVEFVATSVDDALAAAHDQIDRLLDEGWQPKDVALLTVGSRHPVQTERQKSLGFAEYWEEFWSNDDVFYGHVLGSKAWNGAPSCSASTRTAPATAAGNGSTSGCPGRPTGSWWLAIPPWSSGWADARCWSGWRTGPDAHWGSRRWR